MPSINTPQLPSIGSGIVLTYVGTPNVCAYWEVVGVVAEVEGAPVGSLLNKITMTNNDGRAGNQYLASADPADVGKIERIKVSEGA